jgi:hypothetical protein
MKENIAAWEWTRREEVELKASREMDHSIGINIGEAHWWGGARKCDVMWWKFRWRGHPFIHSGARSWKRSFGWMRPKSGIWPLFFSKASRKKGPFDWNQDIWWVVLIWRKKMWRWQFSMKRPSILRIRHPTSIHSAAHEGGKQGLAVWDQNPAFGPYFWTDI